MRRSFKILAATAATASLAGAVWTHSWVQTLDKRVSQTFSDGPWDLPSRIYASPFLVHDEIALEETSFFERLARLRYREVQHLPTRRGEFRRLTNGVEIFLRGFPYPRKPVPHRRLRIDTVDGTVTRMVDWQSGDRVYVAELEPELLASVGEAHWQQRRLVSLAEVPPRFVNAILTSEDRRFYSHYGVDPRGIARAIVANLTGGKRQGGSTITQQLVKNLFLTPERAIRRKIPEAFLAVVTERRYSKNQILEAYLNEVYLGQDGRRAIHGIWEASHFYFARAPNELSLAEAALLTGLIPAPNKYSPHRHPERARKVRDRVLRQMAEVGSITQGEFARAVSEPIETTPPRIERVRAPYFTEYVRRRASALYPTIDLKRNGYELFTTLDSSAQKVAAAVLQNGLEQIQQRYPKIGERKDDLQAALIAIHPQSGAIVAMVGGRSYGKSQFNRAVQARRQPGSVFKPIVFLAAFEKSRTWPTPITPATMLDDTPFEWHYDRRTWRPQNYADTYLGPVSARRALELSLNSATARLAADVGLGPIRATALALGIDRELPALPSLSLGAVEVSPLEVAEVYASIANGGVHIDPRALRKVLSPNGELIEAHPPTVSRAISPETAFLVTHILQGVIESGTGRGARERGFVAAAAGKTGTTNDGRDAWFAGFTPNLVAVVWVGYDDGEPLGLTGAQAALPIWTDFMKQASAGRPATKFSPPSGLTMVEIDPATGRRAGSRCPRTILEAFPVGQEPIAPCEIHDSWF